MGHICGRLGRLPWGLDCCSTSVRAATAWIRQREEGNCKFMICAWTSQIRGVTCELYREASQKYHGNHKLIADQPLEGSCCNS